MDTTQTTTTRSARAFAAIAIVGAMALSVVASGVAIHDYYSGANPAASIPASFTDARIQGVNRYQVVKAD